jgi:hypothetical protein
MYIISMVEWTTGMDYWSGVLDWTTGGVWTRMRKTVFVLAEILVGAVVYLLESAMDRGIHDLDRS